VHEQVRRQHIERFFLVFTHANAPRQVGGFRGRFEVIGLRVVLAHSIYCALAARVSPPQMTRFDDSILRMIDANLNRSREGMRVMEDIARFVLDAPGLSQRLKESRHALRTAVGVLPVEALSLVASRDTMGDVGTRISTDAEQQRSDSLDLASAASKRTTEALRVIEESAKALGINAAPFESIRYTMYDIERDLLLALRPPCPQWALCVLITRELCTQKSAMDIVALAAEGGAGCIQIREKDMPDAEFLDHAARLTEFAHTMGMHVMINDRVHIAKLVGADGVHLGQDDLPIKAARALLGPTSWIGRTCPSINHAIEAIEQGADTCGLGPVFPSSTKAKPELAGVELIERYLDDNRTRSTPMLAISGITPGNVERLANIGCPGVAVSSAVCSSEDPLSATRAIIRAISTRDTTRSPTIHA
jgi:thiamine-phosphate pyrophosphorylase